MVMVKSHRQIMEEAIQTQAGILKREREREIEEKQMEECEQQQKQKEFETKVRRGVDALLKEQRQNGGYIVNMEEIKANDSVNHPKHYEGHTSIECIDNMRLIFGNQRVAEYCMLNAYKYLSRHEYKNGLEDLKKAEWYLNHAENMNLIYDDVSIDLEYIDKMNELRKRYEKKYEVNK